MILVKDLGIFVYEKVFIFYNFYDVDECFFIGIVVEVIVVIEVDGRKIGNGEVGLIIKKFMEEFKKFIFVDGVDIYE